MDCRQQQTVPEIRCICCRAAAFQNLTDLDLSLNALRGTLSPFWGGSGGFTSLQNLDLSNNSFAGQMPLAWGSNGSFPGLVHLLLSNNSLSGGLPTAWGTRGRWPALAGLYLQNNDLSGESALLDAAECRACIPACVVAGPEALQLLMCMPIRGQHLHLTLS